MSINVNEHFKNGFRAKWIQAKLLNNKILYLYYTYYIYKRINFFIC